MKNAVLTKSLKFISKYQVYSDEELERISYGLEGLYLTVTKLIVIIVLSLLLNMFREVVGILILFNFIRYFGFGIHAKKSSECLISSLLCFIVIPYCLLNINLSREIIIIIGIVCTTVFIIYAPADTVKRPLKNPKKRMIRKIMTTLIGIVYIILSLMISNSTISTLFIASVIIEAVMINPITYKILRQPYNNYKRI